MKQNKNRLKPYGLFLLMTLWITPTWAGLERCTEANGGVLFQGENNVNYCVSTTLMNWFSAFSWCKAVGGKLATISEACPGTGTGTCTNIKGKQSVVNGTLWTATPYSNNSVYRISPSSAVNYTYQTEVRKSEYSALCIGS